MFRCLNVICVLMLLFSDFAEGQSTEESAKGINSHGLGQNGGVAAGGAEAVAIGLQILRNGGNAADSTVATLLALSVTDSNDFCFGGEVPILIYDAKRRVVEAISGVGVAPRLATRDYFVLKSGGRLTANSRALDQPGGIPLKGLEPAATPAVLATCLTLLDRYGTSRFEDVVTPTLTILDRHTIDWHARLATTLRRMIDAEKSSPDDRSRGLRFVGDFFYRGPIAREISTWCEENGGLLRYVDFATYVTRIEEPASIDYKGHVVYKCGPWTQGPSVLEALRILETDDLNRMGHNSSGTIHTLVESMKLALADRDVYYADPLFADVPLSELLSSRYGSLRRSLIDPERASLLERPGDPKLGKALLTDQETREGLSGPNRDTTTCVVADKWGNMVAATPSGWQGVEAGKTGVWLGTRLQSFNLWEGHPNCIEPGKRPRITLTPTLVTKNGKPSLAISVAGGDSQDQATLQLLVNHIDFGLSPVMSLAAARFGTNHHMGSFRQTPAELGSLIISPDIGENTLKELAAKGHLIRHSRAIGSPVVLVIDPASGLIEAAGDPRTGRHAGAY
jgi:gamma-glutamyltranspeptidase/glutathione hydrolase